MRLYRWLMELLFPEKCVLCGAVLEKGQTDLCKNCRIEAPNYTNQKTKLQFLDSFAAVWYYEGNVRKSILRYKFYHARSFAPAYGRLLAMRILEQHPAGFDLLTWVPVSPLRRLTRGRGYDQVHLLARAVGRELGMTPVPLLKKVRHNPPQSGLPDPALRRANVLGVYRIRPGQPVAGKRILLLDDVLTTGATAGEAVDDVLTTGATAGEAARILLTAGAKEVHCAAVAAARK